MVDRWRSFDQRTRKVRGSAVPNFVTDIDGQTLGSGLDGQVRLLQDRVGNQRGVVAVGVPLIADDGDDLVAGNAGNDRLHHQLRHRH
jgi:hypothetical protein